MRPLIRVLVVAVLLTPVLARGQEAGLLKPFVDEQTIMIARVDFTKLDIPALRAWLLDAVRNGGGDVKSAEGVIDEVMVPAQRWIKSFTAAGGSRIYLLGDTTFAEPTLVVPLAKDADFAALKGIIPPATGGFETTQRDNLLVRARPARLAQMAQAADRPEIAAALASAGDPAVALVLVPSADARKALEQLMPVLPPELGGKPTAFLLGGLSHGVWTLESRPKVAMRVFLQMADPTSAQNAAAGLTAMIDAARKNPELARLVSPAPGLLELLKPVAAGNRVDLPLEAAAPKLAVALVDAAMLARGSARMVASMSNARQIVMACHMYSSENKSAFPANLDQLKPYFKEPRIFTLPHRPGAAWVYLSPPPLNKIAEAGNHLVLHEPADPWPAAGVVAAFADGHVQAMHDQKQFQDMLQKTLAANKAK